VDLTRGGAAQQRMFPGGSLGFHPRSSENPILTSIALLIGLTPSETSALFLFKNEKHPRGHRAYPREYPQVNTATCAATTSGSIYTAHSTTHDTGRAEHRSALPPCWNTTSTLQLLLL
jgi:hypothetical protein